MARAFEGVPTQPLSETEVAAAEPAAEEGSFLDRLLNRLTGAPDPDRSERLQRYFQPREDSR